MEALIHDLFREIWGDPLAQRHGRSGHEQHGVDSFGLPAGHRGYTGVQVKSRDYLIRSTLTEAEIREEVEKAKGFEPPLETFIIATTLPRDPKFQKVARRLTVENRSQNLFDVAIMSWDDLVEALDRHPEVAGRYYPLFRRGQQLSGTGQSDNRPRPGSSSSRRARKISSESAPVLLPLSALNAAGLVALSPFPPKVESLRSLFPSIQWTAEISRLRRAKAIRRTDDGVLTVPRRVAKAVWADDAHEGRLLEEWVAALTPLRGHVDVALFLAIQRIRQRRFAEAVEALVDVAEGMESGSWNSLYRTALETLDRPHVRRLLSPELYVRFLNATGLTAARGEEPQNAVRYFRRSRRASKQAGDDWGLGQSLINEGAARLRIGDTGGAVQCYQAAVQHAEQTGDALLLGRSLHNLASLASDDDLDEAERLLLASVAAKREAADSPKGPAVLNCRGVIAGRRGDHAAALGHFSAAYKAAHKSDDREGQVVALCNMGKENAELGRPAKAETLYARARTICEEEGFSHRLRLAVSGEAYAHADRNHYKQAEELLLRLHGLAEGEGHEEEANVALQDAAVMRFRRGEHRSAMRLHRRALTVARTRGLDELVHRALRNRAFFYVELGDPARAIATLERTAKGETATGQNRVAAMLYGDLIGLLIENDAPHERIRQTFDSAIAAWRTSRGAAAKECETREQLYAWLWENRQYDDAIAVLRETARFAATKQLNDRRVAILNQLGVCLEETGRREDAIRAVREALSLVESAALVNQKEDVLLNLGELLRRDGKPDEAAGFFKQAEAIAGRTDPHSAIIAAHNRALALFDRGRRREAIRLLRKCRDQARSSGFTFEYVRAIHGLANCAWMMKRHDEAQRFYRRALVAARRHDLPGQIWQIAFNLSNVARWKGQPKRALSYLREAIEHCDSPAEIHRCFAEAAECHRELGNLDAAKEHWEESRRLATAVSDRDAIAAASSSLAEILRQEEKYAAADKELQVASSNADDPEDRITLLAERFQVLLATGKEDEAGSLFDEVVRAARSEGLRDVVIDVHMAAGDHNWKKASARPEAMKAYYAALGESYGGEDVDEYLRRAFLVGHHIAQKLTSLQGAGSQGEVASLERGIVSWLHEQGMTAKDASSALLQWPFGLARRLSALPEGKEVSPRRFVTMVFEEMGFKPRAPAAKAKRR